MRTRKVGLIGAGVSCLALATAATAVLATAAPTRPHSHRLEHMHTFRAKHTVRADATGAGAVPDYVSNIAQRIASEMGDGSPTAGNEVYTTRQAAEGLTSGAVVDTNVAVYLVELRGNFVDKYARIPAGGSFPTGTEVDFTIDPRSRTILDLGISNNSPDISSLGSVSAVPFN